MRLHFYLLLQLLFVQFAGRLAIRCYSCAGTIDKKQANDPCLSPAENVGDGRVSEIECLNSKLCWKGITGGQLKRGCGEKRCAFIPDINMGTFVSQTCCANDLCNRTSAHRSASWMSFFCLIRYLTNKFDWINSRFLLCSFRISSIKRRNNVFLFLSSHLFIHSFISIQCLHAWWALERHFQNHFSLLVNILLLSYEQFSLSVHVCQNASRSVCTQTIGITRQEKQHRQDRVQRCE